MPGTKNFALLATASLMLLSGCASVRPGCPKPPVPPAREAPAENYQIRMQQLLSGTVPTPSDYALPSKPVKLGSGLPTKR